MDTRPVFGKRQLLQMVHLITQTMACTEPCESIYAVTLCSRLTQVWELHRHTLGTCVDCTGFVLA